MFLQPNSGHGDSVPAILHLPQGAESVSVGLGLLTEPEIMNEEYGNRYKCIPCKMLVPSARKFHTYIGTPDNLLLVINRFGYDGEGQFRYDAPINIER